MSAILFTEVRKLKGSLATALCIVSPTMVAVLLGLICLRHKVMPWPEALEGTVGLWSFFVLPMSVTALCVLVAQIEHGPRAWDYLLALPVPRWRIFAAKAVVVLGLLAAMSILLAVELPLVGFVLNAFAPHGAPAGPFPWELMRRYLTSVWGAAFFLTIIQLWVALRFRSFVPCLTLGVAGTFFAVMASGLPEGVFVPWMMPLNILAHDPTRAMLALRLGVTGGVIAAAAMVVHLARQEIRS